MFVRVCVCVCMHACVVCACVYMCCVLCVCVCMCVCICVVCVLCVCECVCCVCVSLCVLCVCLSVCVVCVSLCVCCVCVSVCMCPHSAPTALHLLHMYVRTYVLSLFSLPNPSEPQFNITITFDPNVCDTQTYSKMIINITTTVPFNDLLNYVVFENRSSAVNGNELYGLTVDKDSTAYGYVYSAFGKWPAEANGLWEVTLGGEGISKAHRELIPRATTHFIVVESKLDYLVLARHTYMYVHMYV